MIASHTTTSVLGSKSVVLRSTDQVGSLSVCLIDGHRHTVWRYIDTDDLVITSFTRELQRENWIADEDVKRELAQKSGRDSYVDPFGEDFTGYRD